MEQITVMPRAAAIMENYSMQIFGILSELLANGPKRVSYDDIAAQIGCARSTVRYNIGKMLSAGIVGYDRTRQELYLMTSSDPRGRG